mmetsp:Transcript_15249/g.43637  ORF Transcript_15249/g.43637 Transcript_15249/m.43637 type:complete len:273 (+) Transcript_15249:302-1120(+)
MKRGSAHHATAMHDQSDTTSFRMTGSIHDSGVGDPRQLHAFTLCRQSCYLTPDRGALSSGFSSSTVSSSTRAASSLPTAGLVDTTFSTCVTRSGTRAVQARSNPASDFILLLRWTGARTSPDPSLFPLRNSGRLQVHVVGQGPVSLLCRPTTPAGGPYPGPRRGRHCWVPQGAVSSWNPHTARSARLNWGSAMRSRMVAMHGLYMHRWSCIWPLRWKWGPPEVLLQPCIGSRNAALPKCQRRKRFFLLFQVILNVLVFLLGVFIQILLSVGL